MYVWQQKTEERDVISTDVTDFHMWKRVEVECWSYQQNLYGAQYVHRSSEGGSQIETETHSPSKLRTQRSGDHVVRATGFGKINPG